MSEAPQKQLQSGPKREGKPVILSGVKPTNRLTLGNYLGALRNWANLQKEYDCYFPGVDLHSITVRQDPAELRRNSHFVIASYIASGIDPDACALFLQSHVPEHAELGWIINCHSYMGELSRMTQFKDKSAKSGKNIPAGLFSYPTLMAADILLYDADLVPVGEDQKQHLELTRNVAERMNNLYGQDLFRVPEPYIGQAGARVMDLQDPTMKMGKSDSTEGGAVFLDDTDKQIAKKIKRAVTDSGTEIKAAEDKPGVTNLLTIQSTITGKSLKELEAAYVGKQYGHLKVDTAELVVETLRPIREETERLMGDLAYLDGLLKKGAEKARAHAARTLSRVYERVGFVPKP